MYEHRRSPLLPVRLYYIRLARHAALAGLVVLVSLAAGMAGYAYFERLGWIDAFLNSAMLLGGMGPVDAPKTPGGKLFAGCYALYAPRLPGDRQHPSRTGPAPAVSPLPPRGAQPVR